jgi:predicted DNA-binding protein (MmcQ/YjbR family)
MFALVNMARDSKPVLSFSAGPERYPELLEHDGVIPAPYMARIHWVALEHWGALEGRELARLLAAAHALTYEKLSKRTENVLALPPAELRKLVQQRRKMLAKAT